MDLANGKGMAAVPPGLYIYSKKNEKVAFFYKKSVT